MTRDVIGQLLERVQLPDNHEFCTAFANHADAARAAGGVPMPLVRAVQMWARSGALV